MSIIDVTKVKLCQETRKINIVGEEEKTYIKSPEDAIRVSDVYLKGLVQECMIGIVLNTKNEILAVRELYRGTNNTLLVNPREVYQFALLNNGSAVILVHNHPSGDRTPSKEDIESAKRLKQAGEYIGIDFLDFIVYADESNLGLKELSYI